MEDDVKLEIKKKNKRKIAEINDRARQINMKIVKSHLQNEAYIQIILKIFVMFYEILYIQDCLTAF